MTRGECFDKMRARSLEKALAKGHMTSAEIAELWCLSAKTAQEVLSRLRSQGIVCKLWVSPHRVEWMLPAEFEWFKQVTKEGMRKTRKANRERFRERQMKKREPRPEVDRMPIRQRIISASQAPALQITGVRSVFELGAV